MDWTEGTHCISNLGLQFQFHLSITVFLGTEVKESSTDSTYNLKNKTKSNQNIAV